MSKSPKVDRHQCSGITEKNAQCKRLIPLNQTYCYSHLNQANRSTPVAPVAPLRLPTTIPPRSVSRNTLVARQNNSFFPKLPLEVVNGPNYGRLTYDDVSVPVPLGEYVTAWIPVYAQENHPETGREQKYGGLVPFFSEGDVWPTEAFIGLDSDRPLVFVAQFVDPRENNRILTQIFMQGLIDEDDPTGTHAYIRKIPLDYPLQQIVIETPPYGPDVIPISNVPSIIVGWQRVEELRPSVLVDKGQELSNLVLAQEALKGVNAADINPDALLDDIVDSYRRYLRFKIGGFGNTQQSNDFEDEYNNIYNGMYGDSGSLHISYDGIVEGDSA